MKSKEVGTKIEEFKDECVDFLTRICSIPAIGPESQGAGEMEKYRVIQKEVVALGPDMVEEVHAPDDRVPDGVRPNLLAVLDINSYRRCSAGRAVSLGPRSFPATSAGRADYRAWR